MSKFDNDSLGTRMKDFESVPKIRLVRNVPVLMRLDGKAFHTFTRGMERPYDQRFHDCMAHAAKSLCESIQGCKLAYVQSDEITLLLTDWDSRNTEPWFGYEVQKMCSVGASLCTAAFNAKLAEVMPDRTVPASATFDCRVWNLPDNEVVNCFVWRQQDAVRNSIQMLGQSHFSHKVLHGLSCSDIQDALVSQRESTGTTFQLGRSAESASSATFIPRLCKT